ncbi:hypothetical protein ACFL3U_00090 [Pseudomonadota bacterium]
MQIETIMMMIPAIQVGIAAAALAASGYLMVSSIYAKVQQRFGS